MVLRYRRIFDVLTCVAYQMNKPIIIISRDIYYVEHPFIKIFASVIVRSVEELLEKKYINEFYKAIVTAEYEDAK